MKLCKICGKPADTDRLLCKECYRLSRSGHLGKDIPTGKDFIINGNNTRLYSISLQTLVNTRFLH